MSGKNWLTSFTIDIVFEILAKNTSYSVIPCDLASNTMTQEEHNDYVPNYFADIFNNAKYIVMPFFINNNYFNLIIIGKNFLYIDPYGEKLVETERFFKKIILFLENLNNLLLTNSQKIIKTKHFLQSVLITCYKLIVTMVVLS